MIKDDNNSGMSKWINFERRKQEDISFNWLQSTDLGLRKQQRK